MGQQAYTHHRFQLRESHLLIADRMPMTRSVFEQMQRELAENGLRTDLVRQSLVGVGATLVEQGDEATLKPIADILFNYGIPVSIIPRPYWSHFPDVLKTVVRDAQGFNLVPWKGDPVRIDHTTVVVAVLGDLSGEMLGRAVSLQAAHNTYHDGSLLNDLDREKLLKRVFSGTPFLDLYVSQKKNRDVRVIRVALGEFSANGLGDLRKPFQLGNMQALMTLARRHAAAFSLRFEFGLAGIPGCRFDKNKEQWQNLDAFSLFGTLMLEHVRLRRVPADSGPKRGIAPEEAAKPVQLSLPPVHHEAAEHIVIGWKELLPILPRLAAVLIVGAPVILSELAGPLVWLWSTGLVPLLAGVGLLWQSLRTIHLKRSIENMPTSKVRSMAMGMVELAGKTKRKYAVVAPMSQAVCVWYRLEHYRKSPEKGGRVVRVVESGHIPFLLDDGTGTVEIDPYGANITAEISEKGDGIFAGGVPIPGSSGSYWVERRIPEGATLYVLGEAHPKRGVRDAGIRARITERLRRLKADPDQLAQIDRNGDGAIDSEEWDVARKAAEQAELVALLQDPQGEETEVVVARPQHRKDFFLIAESEENLLRNMKMCWTFLYLVGGILATIWGLWKFIVWLMY